MDNASESLFALKPVTFHYKKEIDPTRTSQFGLVAEEVEKVDPALVVRDKEGKLYSVRYDQVNAMLLNEFLKEHRKVEKQASDYCRVTVDSRKPGKEIRGHHRKAAEGNPSSDSGSSESKRASWGECVGSESNRDRATNGEKTE